MKKRTEKQNRDNQQNQILVLWNNKQNWQTINETDKGKLNRRQKSLIIEMKLNIQTKQVI